MQKVISGEDFSKWEKEVSALVAQGWQVIPGTVFIAIAGVPGSGNLGEHFSRAPRTETNCFVVMQR